jgi:septal ring factor EnvC (AmiA/AmiB activator)
LEELAKGRNKTVISNLEAKVAAVEEQLHLEANEKQRISREFKKNEKRLRDLQAQIEEERKQTENYKEQVGFIISKRFIHLFNLLISKFRLKRLKKCRVN